MSRTFKIKADFSLAYDSMCTEMFSTVYNAYKEFWGTMLESNSFRALKETFGIHVVMACIHINDEIPQEDPDHIDETAAVLWLEKDNDRYQLCRLNQKWRQQTLNLIFEEGSAVQFYVDSNAPIYIYGYALEKSDTDDRFCEKAEVEALSTSPTSVNDNSPLGKYSHIIDTTCYTISDGDSKDSSKDNQSRSSGSAVASESECEYTSESTPRSVSLGSATSCESPSSSKKVTDEEL